MTVTAASFRSDFPEFTDTTRFPDQSVNLWLSVAAKWIDPDTWAELADFGTELFVAHHIIMQAQSAAAAASGGAIGAIVGPTSSKGVGPVSVSYDVGAVLIKDAAHWNQTNYGVQFYQLSQMFGAGGIQL